MTDDALSRPTVHALLADGTTVCIRPVVAVDHDQLEGLYEEMSPENLRLRFFGVSRRSAEMAADRACRPHPGYRALLAEIKGQVIGLAEYDTGGTGTAADISIAVADGLHHRGVGTLLVEHLVSAARAEGITTFTADALSENHEMLRVFADLGLRTARRFEGPEMRCTIELDEDENYLSATEARGRAADVASLEPLLLRLSRMASDLPQLAEADFNPVLAVPGGVSVLDARVRLLPSRPQDPYLRRLR
jgi:GNAT superfamily N-acetyltransferase